MAVPRLPFSAVRLSPRPVPWEAFDDQFWSLVQDGRLEQGYFALCGDDEAAYLFVVNGAPYGSGRYERDRFRFGDLKEFFEFYRRHANWTLACYQVEKGLILGLLAMVQKPPTQQFTTDLVDMQEAMQKVTAKGANAIITHRTADRVGLSLFMKGRLQFNYFCEDDPARIPKESNPLDSLVVYVYGQKETGPVSVGIFEEPKVSAAPDAAQVKPAERPRLTQLFGPVKPAPPGPRPELVVTFGGKTLERHPMVVDVLTIGRAPGNDIRIDNLGVSRQHAAIKQQGGRYVLEDLGSSNGTFVNGERVAGPRELADGDQITVVKHTILFQLPRAQAPTAPVEMAAEQTMFVTPTTVPRMAPSPGGAAAAQPSAPAAPAPGALGGLPRPPANPRIFLPDLSEVPINKPTTTFGSGYEADIKAEGFMIGKIHARIDRDKEGRCRFVKMGRLASTKINNQKMETKVLRDNDVIEIGNTKFIFRSE